LSVVVVVGQIIPRIGQAVTGNPEAYQYLVESIRQFPKQEDLVAEVEAAGFQVRRLEGVVRMLRRRKGREGRGLAADCGDR
jgi:ubiquinone/menaquinone biosynthesis C-methylase UbiE